MRTVHALILTGYGLNCDHETAYAFELAGARAHRIHINALIDREVLIEDFQILVFVGGFSWGDDHGAGVLQAIRMKSNLGEEMRAFIENGNLVLGICNGFQTLVNLGLLPGLNGHGRSVALIANDCGNFRDDWVHLRVMPESPCVFVRGIERLELPVRHGEGKFYADGALIDRLVAGRRIVLQYALSDGRPAEGRFPRNPNGSVLDIAGICDETGRVFGLMPHPEAFNHWTNHPDWPRIKESMKRKGGGVEFGLTPGIRMMKNAVDYFHNG